MEYQVFLSRKNLDEQGEPTAEVSVAKELHDHLVDLGVHTFLDNVSLMKQGTGKYKRAIDDALDQVKILITVGSSRENLESEWVRYEWDSFFNDIISGIKPDAQVISLTTDLKPAELPRALRQSQAFDYEKDGIIAVGEFVLNALGLNQASLSRHPLDTTVLDGTDDKAILFIDVFGSTKLFDEYGDEVAERILSKTIRDWTNITQYHYGQVILAIGDEIECSFDSADDCVKAAIAIQEEIRIGLRGESIQIQVRMGMSYGEVFYNPETKREEGQAVFTAAKMVGVAKADQMIIDEFSVDQLTKELADLCIRVSETKVKNLKQPVTYFQIK